MGLLDDLSRESEELKSRAEALEKKHGELVQACARQEDEIQQTLAQALEGFPWYKDDQVNFPGATVENGVCVGEYTAADLAQVAAAEIKRLREKLAKYEARFL